MASIKVGPILSYSVGVLFNIFEGLHLYFVDFVLFYFLEQSASVDVFALVLFCLFLVVQGLD